MCNKRRSFYKYNLFGTTILKLLAVIFVLIFSASCKQDKHLIGDRHSEFVDYNKLTDAVINRDAAHLMEISSHPNSIIANNAWRGLAVTKTGDFYAQANNALMNNNRMAWYALSYQEIQEPVLQIITNDFMTGKIAPNNACLIFVQHGDIETLKMLMTGKKKVTENESCSRAVGNIMARVEAGTTLTNDIVELAQHTTDEITIRNLLYGFRRSALNRPPENSTAHQQLIAMLTSRGDKQATIVDEYLVAITGKTGFKTLIESRLDQLKSNIQLAIVTAAQLRYFEPGELDLKQAEWFLTHSNPQVVVQTLESLKMVEYLDKEWVYKLKDVVSGYHVNAEVSLAFLELMSQVEVNLQPFEHQFSSIEHGNIFLSPRILELYRELLPPDDYIQKLYKGIEEGGFTGRSAIISLVTYWKENRGLFSEERMNELIITELDRGDLDVVQGIGQILLDINALPEQGYEILFNQYRAYVEDGDFEYAKVLGDVLQDHFPNRFQPLFDPAPNPFQKPNWQRLFELGSNPVWVLETQKGVIKMELNSFSAPFTVSAVDSLTRLGRYNGVPFHRVVRNFVIQGGDFSRRNGAGNAGFRLPTEPSFQTFGRRSVGVASSGPDTEGSQFFITHTWTPHLDGLYTNFGEVTEGMDVVDSIQIGDKIIKARIERRQ